MAKIVVRGNNVLVLPVDIDRVNSSGLLLTSSTEKKEPSTGRVVSQGQDVADNLTGELVTFVIGASVYEKAVLVDGVKHLILPENNIIGVYAE